MKRGQILSRQFIIIASWIVLLVALAIVFIFQSLSNPDTQDTLRVCSATSAPTILSAYLRQTTTINGQDVPMAEALAFYVMTNDEKAFQASGDAFFAAQTKPLVYLEITLPDGKKWTAGKKGGYLGSAKTTLPLPDGKTFMIEYVERDTLWNTLKNSLKTNPCGFAK